LPLSIQKETCMALIEIGCFLQNLIVNQLEYDFTLWACSQPPHAFVVLGMDEHTLISGLPHCWITIPRVSMAKVLPLIISEVDMIWINMFMPTLTFYQGLLILEQVIREASSHIHAHLDYYDKVGKLWKWLKINICKWCFQVLVSRLLVNGFLVWLGCEHE
jgi:hypothetical protein